MNFAPTYPKINSLYKRHKDGPDKGKIIYGDYANDEIGYLADLQWLWTEKVDGTNIRLSWDTHFDPTNAIAYVQGRTDAAQLHPDLVRTLTTILANRADLFREAFSPDVHVTMCGEGYGAGIQKCGGQYRPDKGFVLFDVLIQHEHGQTWLTRDAVQYLAEMLDLDIVPVVAIGSIPTAVHLVRTRAFKSQWDGVEIPEGLVGVPTVGLLDRRGHRIMTKVKWADLKDVNLHGN